MVELTTLILTLAIAALAYLWLTNRKPRHKNPPPGPWGLPLLGNMLQLGNTPYLKFYEWVEPYGKIFRAQMGPMRMVVISDAAWIRDAFNDPNFSGRSDDENISILSDGKHGIANSDGPEWLEQRRFTLRHLRDFGFSKSSMETFINEEVNEFLEFLQKNEGSSLSVMRAFSLAVLNSLWAILTSKRYKHDDPRLNYIFNQNTEMMETMSNSVAMYIPALAKLFPEWTGATAFYEMVKNIRGFSIETIKEHRETLPGDGTTRDFVDVYLREIQATQDPDSSFYKESGERSLIAVMTDLFSAGSDTTSWTLIWAIFYLSKFPEAQKKFQEELDTVVGKNRAASLADKSNLPYTEGVIREVLRMSSLLPFGFFHKTMSDCKFQGFDISKDTLVVPNVFYLHYSPEFWEEPREFRPQRFIAEDGKTLKKFDNLIPFSVGKRACIGEILARDTIFLFLTAIFQKYTVELAPGFENVPIDAKPGFLLTPQDFKVVFRERH